MRYLLLGLALTLAACDATTTPPPPAVTTASYAVTFRATWSAATHPDDFPGNPHFSPLVGAVHTSGTSLWEVGLDASAGLTDVAERGVSTVLQAEVGALGTDAVWVGGPPIGTSPGTASLTLDVRSDRPLVSLVSMLAPSPDWFVGVDRLDLRSGAGWRQALTVDLIVYDAGTDDGTSYTAANAPAAVPQPVGASTHPYFNGSTAQRTVGTLTFTRTDG